MCQIEVLRAELLAVEARVAAMSRADSRSANAKAAE